MGQKMGGGVLRKRQEPHGEKRGDPGREGVQFRYLDGSVGSIKNEKEQPEERD